MFDIMMWAQMFFEDGSVTQGMRFPAEWMDPHHQQHLAVIACKLLKDVNRSEGWLMLWGAGNMSLRHYPSAFLKETSSGSDS